MARHVILSNNSLTIGLNEYGLVNDFYYPYVGLENLSNARLGSHKIGLWVDDTFSWVDDGSWGANVDFEDDALISNIHLYNTNLQLEIILKDFVHHSFNVFCRNIKVINHASEKRNVRLFMHQVFQISRAGRADTGLYVPDESYILDYKGNCCLLIYGQDNEGKPFDQFAIGNYRIEGKEGTFKDAEDGELSGSAVEHGGVDSVIRFNMNIKSNQSNDVDYWIVAADTQTEAEKIHLQIKKTSLNHCMQLTRNHWHKWLSTGTNRLHQTEKKFYPVAKKSLMIIKAHMDKHGGIIASSDSSIYNYGRDYYSYVWPRDGAYAIWPLIRLGYTDEPKAFFRFCKEILHPDGYMMHKYQPDKAIGSTWHPLLHNNTQELGIQEDETAIIIYMLGEYYQYSQDADFVHSMYEAFIKPAADFMSSYIDEHTNLPHASYDLWEEKFLTTTYTASITYQGLVTAADFATLFGQHDDAVRWNHFAQMIQENNEAFINGERQSLRKGFMLQQDGSLQFDNTLDVSSLYGAMMYGLFDKNASIISLTAMNIESSLLDKSPSGGSPRYENDNYFLTKRKYTGNPWYVTTFWMAQYYIRIRQNDKAKHYVDWSLEHMLPSGAFSEQIDPETGFAVSVTPLVWSHAEFVNTILDLSK